jgi:hypothetical protein
VGFDDKETEKLLGFDVDDFLTLIKTTFRADMMRLHSCATVRASRQGFGLQTTLTASANAFLRNAMSSERYCHIGLSSVLSFAKQHC